MKQVKINDILYVMDTEAYAITADTDASIIYVPEDYYDDYVAINSGLTLTKYNYGVIRVTKPEYDVPEPPTPTKETRLVITYDVQSTAQPTQIYLLGDPTSQPVLGAVDFSAIEIDGSDVSVETIDNANGTYQFTTTGEHIVKYTIKNGSISDYRFFYPQLGTIVIPVTSIFIPSDVTSIGNDVFNYFGKTLRDTNWSGIETIVVDDDNEYYSSNGNIGNCIVEISTHTLLYISNNTIIPDDVTTISDNIGGYNKTIEELVIPNSVTTIGESVFIVSNLKSVTFGSGITTIGGESFTDCESLNVITIVGTNDLIDVIPYGVWGRLNTVYVDSSMVSTYQAFATDEGFEFEVLAME